MLGPLLFRDDLDLQKPAAMHMTPALFLGEDTRLEVALRRMQRAGERLAIVLAHDGTEMGVVSLEDISKADVWRGETVNWDAVILMMLKILAVLALVLLNGFFVAAEFALVRIRETQLDILVAKAGGGRNGAAHRPQSEFLSQCDATRHHDGESRPGLDWPAGIHHPA